nr:Tail-associated lysozyme gp5-like protein [uncultured Mediterranean phage uvMED]
MDNSHNAAGMRDLFGMQKGFIEDVKDPKASGRVKVRIINKEFRTGQSGEFIPVPATQDLPWAAVLMPSNASGGTATSCSSHNIRKGDIVWCFFINGDSRQRLVVGSQGAVANASAKRPEAGYAPLQRYISQDSKTGDLPDPTSHVTDDQKEKNKNFGTKPIGAYGDDDVSRKIAGLVEAYSPGGNPQGAVDVAVADGKCATNPATKTEIVLAEFFGAVQSTNGNVGSYYISKYTGELFDLQTIAKGYITRIQTIIEAVISRSFGMLMAKLKEVIQKLIKAVLQPLPGCLKQVVDWFTDALERMGCQMTDIFERMGDFIEETLMGYIGSVVNWAACQTKRLVDGLLGKVMQEITGVIDDIFGSISSVLGAIGSIGDVVGGAISAVMDLLGISCTGIAACSDGPPKRSTKSGAFSGLKAGYNDLDELLASLQDGEQFPIDGVCDAATVAPVAQTDVNIWGIQIPDEIGEGSFDDINDLDDDDDPNNNDRKRRRRRKKNKKTGKKEDFPFDSDKRGKTPTGVRRRGKRKARCFRRFFRTGDVNILNGQTANVPIFRSGDLTTSSGVSFYTVDGTAKAGEDYCATSGFMGFGQGDRQKVIPIRTINNSGREKSTGEVTVEIELWTDDDPDIHGVALDSFSIGNKTWNRKKRTGKDGEGQIYRNTRTDKNIVVKKVKLQAPFGDGKKNSRRYLISYDNLNPTNKPIKVKLKQKQIWLKDDRGDARKDKNARIRILSVKGGEAKFSQSGKALVVYATKDNSSGGGFRTNPESRSESEKQKECKYFYVKMKLNDGCGKVRKKTGIVLVCPPTVPPPPIIIPPPTNPTTVPPVVVPLLEDETSFFTLSADKSKVVEGETVLFTLNTVNVDVGSTVNYTIGRAETGITFGDIEWIKQSGGPEQKVNSAADLAGTFTVAEDGSDFVEIKLREDDVDESDSEVAEQVIVQLNGLGVSAGCLVVDPADPSTQIEPDIPRITDITIDPPDIGEGESGTVKITTSDVPDGTCLPYTMFGANITNEDVIQPLTGVVCFEDNYAEFGITVASNRGAETPENLTFSVDEFGVSATVVLRASDDADNDTSTGGGDDDDFGDDDGDGDGTPEFGAPIINSDGGIIDIPVRKPGFRYTALPFISLDSNTGFGGFVEPILNSQGYLTRVRVIRGGQGYTGNLAPGGIICQLVGFSLQNVGGLYTKPPTVYVNGDSSIAKASLSPEGFVDNIILIKGGMIFVETPEVIITGGDGFGARAKADLQCVPEDRSELILQGLAKDPANYVDCP